MEGGEGMEASNGRMGRIYRYQTVYEGLKAQIVDGVYRPEDLLPSEHSIGEQYQVDRTTVRKALQLLVDDGLVAKKAGKGTIVRGAQAAKRDEALPSPAANRDAIAFILPRSKRNDDRITQPFYATLFYTVEKLCQKSGYKLIYSTLHTVEDFQRETAANAYAGYIFVSNVPTRVLDLALEQKFPSILVNNYYERMTSVLSDNLEGTYRACRYLIERGHKEIGVVKGLPDYRSTQERLRGCIIALQEQGLSLNDDHVLQGEWDYESGYQAVQALLQSGKKLPTALVAFNDHLAVGAVRAIVEAGLQVPADISVVGFDNLEQAEYVSPGLTTVDIGASFMGEVTMHHLLGQIGQGVSHPVKILTPVKLVCRNSVAPPK